MALVVVALVLAAWGVKLCLWVRDERRSRAAFEQRLVEMAKR